MILFYLFVFFAAVCLDTPYNAAEEEEEEVFATLYLRSFSSAFTECECRTMRGASGRSAAEQLCVGREGSW